MQNAVSSSAKTLYLIPRKAHSLPFTEIPSEGISLEAFENELIKTALKQSGGNKTQAARLLGITRDTLRYRAKKARFGEDFRKRLTFADTPDEDSSPLGLNG